MSDEPVMTPITPEESGSPVPPKVSPFGAAPTADAPAAPAAAAPAAAAPGTSTIKLKPVIRKPMIHKPVIGGSKPAVPPSATAPAAVAAAKKATQNLKSVTGPIPAQATLRKTGIIAEGIITPQQQQAAKSKTSRISLESAIGVAPVKDTPAAMKTIRLRRPTDLKPAAPAASAEAAPAAAPAPVQAPAAEAPVAAPPPAPEAASSAEAADASVTQKKTLKLHRPGGIGIKRPSMGIGKPGAAPAAAPAAEGGDVKDMPADLGTVPELKPLAAADFGGNEKATVSGVPTWVAALSLITSLAALAAVGFVVWYLWQEGVGPVAGANEMSFIQM